MKKNNLTLLFIILCSSLGMISCSDALYEKNIDLENSEWSMDTTFSFEFEIQNTDPEYVISYVLRNNLDYPNHNLYMQCFLENGEHEKLKSDIQEVQLMEKKSGRPYGKGFSGIYQNKFVAYRYKFAKPGNYFFKIRQYMREEKLNGIVSVGVEVKKAD